MNTEHLKFYWIGEESELYSGNSLDEILNYFFTEKEIAEIKSNALYEELTGETIQHCLDEETNQIVEKKLKELVYDESKPNLLLTSYL